MLNASQNKCIVELLILFNGKNNVIIFGLQTTNCIKKTVMLYNSTTHPALVDKLDTRPHYRDSLPAANNMENIWLSHNSLLFSVQSIDYNMTTMKRNDKNVSEYKD